MSEEIKLEKSENVKLILDIVKNIKNYSEEINLIDKELKELILNNIENNDDYLYFQKIIVESEFMEDIVYPLINEEIQKDLFRGISLNKFYVMEIIYKNKYGKSFNPEISNVFEKIKNKYDSLKTYLEKNTDKLSQHYHEYDDYYISVKNYLDSLYSKRNKYKYSGFLSSVIMKYKCSKVEKLIDSVKEENKDVEYLRYNKFFNLKKYSTLESITINDFVKSDIETIKGILNNKDVTIPYGEIEDKMFSLSNFFKFYYILNYKDIENLIDKDVFKEITKANYENFNFKNSFHLIESFYSKNNSVHQKEVNENEKKLFKAILKKLDYLYTFIETIPVSGSNEISFKKNKSIIRQSVLNKDLKVLDEEQELLKNFLSNEFEIKYSFNDYFIIKISEKNYGDKLELVKENILKLYDNIKRTSLYFEEISEKDGNIMVGAFQKVISMIDLSMLKEEDMESFFKKIILEDKINKQNEGKVKVIQGRKKI